MPTILKVGYQKFLVKNPKQAADAIKALSEMVAVEHKYIGGDMREVFWPNNNNVEIGFENIRSEQLLAKEPSDDAIEVQARAIAGRKVLSLPPSR